MMGSVRLGLRLGRESVLPLCLPGGSCFRQATTAREASVSEGRRPRGCRKGADSAECNGRRGRRRRSAIKLSNRGQGAARISVSMGRAESCSRRHFWMGTKTAVSKSAARHSSNRVLESGLPTRLPAGGGLQATAALGPAEPAAVASLRFAGVAPGAGCEVWPEKALRVSATASTL